MILPKQEQEEIIKSKLLLVEGNDEVHFFQAMLRKLNKLDDVQIMQVRGVDNFQYEFPAIINMTGFSQNVKSIGIVRDADNNYAAAFQSTQSLIRRNGLIPPNEADRFNITTADNISIGVFIMPGDMENGMLEDLCLRTQDDHPAMECVEMLFECIKTKDVEQPRNIAKAKSQAFLSLMPVIANNVGIAAKKNYWNLNHDCLSNLSDFLEAL